MPELSILLQRAFDFHCKICYTFWRICVDQAPVFRWRLVAGVGTCDNYRLFKREKEPPALDQRNLYFVIGSITGQESDETLTKLKYFMLRQNKNLLKDKLEIISCTKQDHLWKGSTVAYAIGKGQPTHNSILWQIWGLLSCPNQKMRIPHPKKTGTPFPPFPLH